MKVGVLFSGGKDSTFAMYWAEQQGWDLRCLISLNSKNKHSFMFHTPNINLAKVQAECLDLPIIFKDTDGEKEIELEDMTTGEQLCYQIVDPREVDPSRGKISIASPLGKALLGMSAETAIRRRCWVTGTRHEQQVRYPGERCTPLLHTRHHAGAIEVR